MSWEGLESSWEGLKSSWVVGRASKAELWKGIKRQLKGLQGVGERKPYFEFCVEF